MTTTAIFIELLIAGIQASVWVTLLVISIAGYDWIAKIAPKLGDWATLISVAFFAIWYTLGIMIDQMANVLFALVNLKKFALKMKWANRKTQEPLMMVRAAVLSKSENAYSFLEYIRSRMRIMRATALNIVLITISAIIFILSRCDLLGCVSKSNLILVTTGLGIVLVLIAVSVLAVLEVGYDIYLKQFEFELAKTEKEKDVSWYRA